jgi:hypothetical protein
MLRRIVVPSGNRGKYGRSGNVKSAIYRSSERRDSLNPTLTAEHLLPMCRAEQRSAVFQADYRIKTVSKRDRFER